MSDTGPVAAALGTFSAKDQEPGWDTVEDDVIVEEQHKAKLLTAIDLTEQQASELARRIIGGYGGLVGVGLRGRFANALASKQEELTTFTNKVKEILQGLRDDLHLSAEALAGMDLDLEHQVSQVEAGAGLAPDAGSRMGA